MEEGIEHRSITINGRSMHIAESGQTNRHVVILLHGFPQLWYTWRHHLLSLSSLGYHALAPDLRGYDTSSSSSLTTRHVPAYNHTATATSSFSSFTSLHVAGDLAALIDEVAGKKECVFVVGHDWGAVAAWALCMYVPEKVKAAVIMSVPFSRRNPNRKPVEALRAAYGDDYYICRFQEPGEIEAEFAEIGTKRVLRNILTYRNPGPLRLPKGNLFGDSPNNPVALPSWLSEEDLDYYTRKFEQNGFTGALNYYRALDLNWELTAPWTNAQVKVPVKFIVGDLDLTYNAPGVKDYIHKGGMKKDVPFLQEVVIIKGAAHFLHEERPHEITKHIDEFFRKFTGSSCCIF